MCERVCDAHIWMDGKSAEDRACEVKCKRFACEIQRCLSKRRPSRGGVLWEEDCVAEWRAWQQCCDRVKAELKSGG